MKRILITGATGQIGSELTITLRDIYGQSNIIAAGHKKEPSSELKEGGPFHFIDCQNFHSIEEIVKTYKIDTIFHLVSILSATAEKNPLLAWNVNIGSLINILEIARQYKCAVFNPSSIGAFGTTTPMDNTPQDTIQHPNTIYGITKVSGELLCDYYFQRFAVDTRGLRFPGLISYKTPPGGGTTDYAIEIFHDAIKNKSYSCYLKEDTYLDMMYMPDAIRSTIELMEADTARLQHRNAFNVTSMTVCPKDIAESIKLEISDFSMSYSIDPLRQAIADSWPNHIDDRAAIDEWGWEPQYDLQRMTRDMIFNIRKSLEQ